MRKHKVAVNPGRRKRRKRNMSLKQLLHFGTKKQRAAAKARVSRKRKRSNGSAKRRRRNVVYLGAIKKGVYRYGSGTATPKKRKKARARKRKRNIGSILTVLPNPGRRKRRKNSMAVTKRRRRKVSSHRRRRRHVVNSGRRRYNTYRRRPRSNPGARRHHRRYSRRRNPGILSGSMGQVAGVIGGATLTGMISGYIPSSFMSNQFISYIGIGIVAYLQGMLVGKVFKNATVGKDFAVGGYTYLALKVIKDLMPSLVPSLGLSGMGLIAPSNFYVPQVNQGGSMGSFVRPAGVPMAMPAPAPAGMHGIRRTGRVR